MNIFEEMKNGLSRAKTKASELFVKAAKNPVLAPVVSLALMMNPTLAMASGNYSAVDVANAKTIMSTMIGYILAIFKYVGALLCVWGIGQLVMAFKNEDADSKQKAIMVIVVAAILISLAPIVNAVVNL